MVLHQGLVQVVQQGFAEVQHKMQRTQQLESELARVKAEADDEMQKLATELAHAAATGQASTKPLERLPAKRLIPS